MRILLIAAWKNLSHNKQQFIAAVLAIAFAVLLMFTQMGFKDGMLDSNIAFLQQLNADLIMVNSQRIITTLERTFDQNRLYQARSYSAITAAYPLYISLGTWKNQQTNQERSIRVFAFDLDHPVFNFLNRSKVATELQRPNTVLADLKSRREYGLLTTGITSELSGRTATIVGNFELGADFVADGNLITSDYNFLKIFANQTSGFAGKLRNSLEDVDLGLLQVEAGANLEQVAHSLNQILPSDVRVFTKKAYIDREIDFYSEATLGFIFDIGITIGFAVGTVIVYNIMATDVKKNMPQYGTLIAIGHTSYSLFGMIVVQAVMIAILGFMLGLGTSITVCSLLSFLTGLLVQVKFRNMTIVFCLALSMGILSGSLASRKLRKIDPAEIYA